MRAKLLLVSLVTTLSLFFFGYSALADELSINEERIYVEITSEGSVRVYDNLVFDVSGSYNGFKKQISYDKADSIRITKVQEAVNPQKVNTDFVDYELAENAEDGDKGVYTLLQEGDDVTINIYAPSKNTYRGFRIGYELSGAISKYKDVAELYWKFIDRDNETPIKRLEIYVTYPEGTTADTIRAYAHGPLNGMVKILDDRNAIFTVDNLDSNTMVEIRTLMPSELLSNMSYTSNEEMLDTILAEEESYTDDVIKEQEKKLEIQSLGRTTPLIAILLNVLAAALMVFKLKKPRYNQYQREAINIDAYDPVLLSYYAQPYSTGGTRGILGGLLNLVRKGFLFIEPLKENSSSDNTMYSNESDISNSFDKSEDKNEVLECKEIEISNANFEEQSVQAVFEFNAPLDTDESLQEEDTNQDAPADANEDGKELEALEENELADKQEDKLQGEEHEEVEESNSQNEEHDIMKEADTQEEGQKVSEEIELQEENPRVDEAIQPQEENPGVAEEVEPQEENSEVAEEAEAQMEEAEEESFDNYDESQGSEPWGNSRIVRTDKKESLLPQEEFLIKWFIEEIGDGSSVTLKELTDYFSNDDEAPEKLAKWNQIIADEIEGLGYTDKNNKKYKPLIAAIPVLGGIISIIALVMGNGVGLGSLLLSLGLLVAVVVWPSRSEEGQRAYDNFRYVKEKLKNFEEQDAKDLIANMEQGELFMVYAALLNLKDDYIEKMSAGFEDNYDQSLYANYYLWNCLYMGDINESQGLADSLDEAVRMTEDSSDYSPNSDGFGGSFSGGSDGSSSGGGGGAGGF